MMETQKFLGWHYFIISKNAVQFCEKCVEKSRPFNHGPNGIVDHPRGFIERTYPDTDAAIHPVFCPK
jgi:hypothetical protein